MLTFQESYWPSIASAVPNLAWLHVQDRRNENLHENYPVGIIDERGKKAALVRFLSEILCDPPPDKPVSYLFPTPSFNSAPHIGTDGKIGQGELRLTTHFFVAKSTLDSNRGEGSVRKPRTKAARKHDSPLSLILKIAFAMPRGGSVYSLLRFVSMQLCNR